MNIILSKCPDSLQCEANCLHGLFDPLISKCIARAVDLANQNNHHISSTQFLSAKLKILLLLEDSRCNLLTVWFDWFLHIAIWSFVQPIRLSKLFQLISLQKSLWHHNVSSAGGKWNETLWRYPKMHCTSPVKTTSNLESNSQHTYIVHGPESPYVFIAKLLGV